MAPRVYATTVDYGKFAEEPFDGDNAKLDKRLRSASIEVEKLTRMARFAVDEEGYPTDADVSEAFTEATVAVAEYWSITDDPTGAESQQGAISIGSVSLGTTSSSRSSGTARDKLTARIGSKAIDILENEGLTSVIVSHT